MELLTLSQFIQCLRSNAAATVMSLAVILTFLGCTVGKTASLMKQLDKENAARLTAKYGNGQLGGSIEKADSGERRNILLNDLILLVDLNYNHWEKLLFDKKAGFDLGTDAVVLGLGGATALSGTTELANILGQITTGVTGLKTAVDSDLLQKNAIGALVAKMRAARATQLLKMQAAMIEVKDGKPVGPTPLSQYTVGQGLLDLNAYYNAGTFVSAISDITAKASEEEKTAQDKATTLKPNAPLVSPTPVPTAKQKSTASPTASSSPGD
jgi:hypothetical protein